MSIPQMSLLRLPLVLSDAVAMRISGTPPNPPRPFAQHIIPDWREHFLKSLARPSAVLRAMHWSAGIIEILIILACQNPHGPISQRLLAALIFSGGSPWRIAITPLSIIGAVITLFGTALRIKCYQTLGSLFTFELCIQKNHRLIVDGPYAFVRHPSYTGLILTLVGAFFSHASGSWVAECGLIHTPMGRVLVSFWILVAFAVAVSLLLRVPKEDEILKQRFGDEWTKWAHRVRYRLIPGLY